MIFTGGLKFKTLSPRHVAGDKWRPAESSSGRLASAILLACLLFGSLARADQSEAEQFEAIFGQPKPALSHTLHVPFILDHRPGDDLRVTITSEHEDVQIQAVPLLKQLEPIVRHEIIDDLRAAVAPDGTIGIIHLQASGLEASFDHEELELRVNVPPEIRSSSTTRLFRRSPPPGAWDALAPSPFSAFLNIRTGLDHVQRSATGRDDGFQPFRADLDGALNWRNWVAEGSASFTEGATYPVRRGDLRLVRDDPGRRIRTSFGDLAYPVAGFQSFQPLAGLTVARNFALQPYEVTEPRGQTSFFLRSFSTVEVLVNGRPVRTLQLGPGSHDIEDFLFASGANDVVLRITDDVGRTETIHLSFFFDSRLLAAGEHEFSYSAGLPSQPGDWGPDYEFGKPAFSMFHRTGLTNTLTGGLNLQGNEDQLMYGTEAIWATPFGTFQPDLAMSHIDGGADGYAARLGYRYTRASSPWRSTWTLSAQYLNPTFAALGAMAPWNPVSWNYSARYSQRLAWRMSGGIGGTWQVRREAPETLRGANLFLSKRLGRSGVADLSLDRRETVRGPVENRAFISFTYSFPAHRQRIRTSHDSLSRTSRADWYYTAENPVGGVDANLGVQRRPGDYSAYGGARYTDYRGEASLFQDVISPGSPDRQTESRTRFRFGTALVYTDGHFAVSRPVRDSFAIVVAHPDLAGQKIGIDPVRDSYTAEIDRWGPAVIPDLNSYLVRNVAVDGPDLPPGSDLGPGVYTVSPTYKSGTLIRVGTGATVMASGMLATAEGDPAPLEFGEVVSLADPELAPIEFFTNRGGRFSVGGLRPGNYEMRLFRDPSTGVEFEIPKESAGVYDLGILQLNEAPSKPGENEENKNN